MKTPSYAIEFWANRSGYPNSDRDRERAGFHSGSPEKQPRSVFSSVCESSQKLYLFCVGVKARREMAGFIPMEDERFSSIAFQKIEN